MKQAIIHLCKALARLLTESGKRDHATNALMVALADYVNQHQD